MGKGIGTVPAHGLRLVDEPFLGALSIHQGHPIFKGQNLSLARGAVLFYKDWLVPNKEGYLVTPVGHSPEQGFLYDDGKSTTLSPGPTMDIALIKESFVRYLQALEILGIADTDLKNEIIEKHGKLLPCQIGEFAQLQEWEFDFKDREIHHRHISH